MWYSIKNENDIKVFLDEINYFSDSCIVKMSYLSGSRMLENGSLFPTNSIRSVDITFASQNVLCPSYTVSFKKIHKLLLVPYLECEADSIIYESTLKKKGDYFYWFDYAEENLDTFTPKGTCIVAEEILWKKNM